MPVGFGRLWCLYRPMKVEGPKQSSGVKSSSRTGAKKTGDGSFGAMVNDTEETESSVSMSRTASVGALDALLALQGAESASEEGAKKAKKRAIDLLDQLDRIKVGLLTGDMPLDALQHLSQTLASHRENVLDPRLAEILDEIDLRAQIEMAKLGK